LPNDEREKKTRVQQQEFPPARFVERKKAANDEALLSKDVKRHPETISVAIG
jgi:hypothetical protein